MEAKICCNRKLYIIKAQDSDIYSLPTGQFDKMIVIGRGILDYAFNQFMEQNLWRDLVLIGYKNRRIIGNLEEDPLFRLIKEKFRSHGIFLTEPMNDIVSYFRTQIETLKESLTLNEGFVFTEPYNPWSLQQEFLSIFKDAKSSLKLCVPYPDASTFSFLATVSPYVQIKMIILSDKDDLKKKKKLGIEVLEKTISRKRIETRRNPEIHVRFMIIDDKIVMFSSADLRDDQLKRKYQYGFWTNNEQIVRKVVEYFDNLWNSSTLINLFEELKN